MIELIDKKPVIISKVHNSVEYKIPKSLIIVLDKRDLLIGSQPGSYKPVVSSNSPKPTEKPVEKPTSDEDPDPDFTPPALAAALINPTILSENIDLVSKTHIQKAA